MPGTAEFSTSGCDSAREDGVEGFVEEGVAAEFGEALAVLDQLFGRGLAGLGGLHDRGAELFAGHLELQLLGDAGEDELGADAEGRGLLGLGEDVVAPGP